MARQQNCRERWLGGGELGGGRLGGGRLGGGELDGEETGRGDRERRREGLLGL